VRNALLQGPAWDCYPPTDASHIARITGMYHHTWQKFFISNKEVSLLKFAISVEVCLVTYIYSISFWFHGLWF
jgi:uncharacterized membrane protein